MITILMMMTKYPPNVMLLSECVSESILAKFTYVTLASEDTDDNDHHED